jgi:hypothetical protein
MRTPFERVAVLVFAFAICSNSVRGQVVYQHVSDESIYEFLKEMSTIKAVDLNDVALPLSRKQISRYLIEVAKRDSTLNRRQRAELSFMMQEYIKEADGYKGFDFFGKGLKRGSMFPLRRRQRRHDMIFYRDSLFTLTVNPILGAEGWYTGGSFYYQRRIGASVQSYIGKHLGFYADLRDYSESINLSDPAFLNLRMGANYKGTDFSEMRGGFIVSNKWGSIGVVKDNVVWGSSYNGSNILSGRTPSFPMIRLTLNPVKWFSFEYLHGWLVSDVIDSTASYMQSNGELRTVFRDKYIAANLWTFRPMKRLYFTFGNSIVYSDKFNPVYLIPFLFYKSVDHTLNSTGSNHNFRGQNSQMFINLVSRQLKYTELYLSVFVDEMSISNMFNSQKQSNHISLKMGTRVSLPWKINTSIVIEYTRTNPVAYRHFFDVSTYSSNSYGLGHYLGENAQEIYAALWVKPVPRFRVKADMTYILKGPGSTYERGSDGKGIPFMSSTELSRLSGRLTVAYEIVQSLSVTATYGYLKENGPLAGTTLPNVVYASPHTIGFSVGYGF